MLRLGNLSTLFLSGQRGLWARRRMIRKEIEWRGKKEGARGGGG